MENDDRKPQQPEDDMVILPGVAMDEMPVVQGPDVPDFSQQQGGYERPKCSVAEDGEPCRYEPIRKCGGCGSLICLQHSEEFTSQYHEGQFRQFDGYYCPGCHAKVIDAFNAEVDKYNEKVRMQKRTATMATMGQGTCECLEAMCRSL